jgi:hypothetical protein
MNEIENQKDRDYYRKEYEGYERHRVELDFDPLEFLDALSNKVSEVNSLKKEVKPARGTILSHDENITYVQF